MYDPISELQRIPVRPYLGTGRQNNAWWVRFLCRCLAARDYVVTVADVYDADLARVVRIYQKDHALVADGTVGPKTWAMLANEAVPEVEPDTNSSQIRAMIVKVARLAESLGIRETGGRNNAGASVEWFLHQADGHAGQPWCMAFVYGVVSLAYAACDEYLPDGFKTLSCSALVKWGESHNRVNDLGRYARPGDLLVLRGGNTGYKHVGICVGSTGKLGEPGFKLVTIEGNTNSDGSPDGDGVYLKHRAPDGKKGSICVAVRMG